MVTMFPCTIIKLSYHAICRCRLSQGMYGAQRRPKVGAAPDLPRDNQHRQIALFLSFIFIPYFNKKKKC